MQETGIPTLQIVPIKDRTIIDGPTPIKQNEGSKTRTYLLNLLDRVCKPKKGNSIHTDDEFTATLITSDITKDPNIDEHSIELIDRNEKWSPKSEIVSENGAAVSLAAGYALALSIANSIQNEYSTRFIPKPSLTDLIKDLQQNLAETNNNGMLADITESHIDIN